MSPVETMRPV